MEDNKEDEPGVRDPQEILAAGRRQSVPCESLKNRGGAVSPWEKRRWSHTTASSGFKAATADRTTVQQFFRFGRTRNIVKISMTSSASFTSPFFANANKILFSNKRPHLISVTLVLSFGLPFRSYSSSTFRSNGNSNCRQRPSAEVLQVPGWCRSVEQHAPW